MQSKEREIAFLQQQLRRKVKFSICVSNDITIQTIAGDKMATISYVVISYPHFFALFYTLYITQPSNLESQLQKCESDKQQVIHDLYM